MKEMRIYKMSNKIRRSSEVLDGKRKIELE